ncbi:MAG TPA: hypothetical protein VJG67_03240 [Candidatus Paceibacterota bacterium]
MSFKETAVRRILTVLIVLTSLALTTEARAQQQQAPIVDTTGLSAEQVKALNAAVTELRKQPANTLANLTLQTATPDKFKEWVDAGSAAGKAVGAFSKEVGVAADQFLKTDVGRIGLYTLIWKFGGDKVVESILNMTLKFVLAVVLFTFWWKMVRRFVMNERRTGTTEYNPNTFLRWLGFNKKTVDYEKDDWMSEWPVSDQFWITFWTRVGAVVVAALITLVCWPSVTF